MIFQGISGTSRNIVDPPEPSAPHLASTAAPAQSPGGPGRAKKGVREAIGVGRAFSSVRPRKRARDNDYYPDATSALQLGIE